jgi:nucleoside-diphosphate-sugar epimerase
LATVRASGLSSTSKTPRRQQSPPSRGGPAGIYNVVDDQPASASEFLPVLAAAVGAKHPFRVPRWLGRLAADEVAVMTMTEIRGASNDKAKRELGWQLRYPTWRRGFAEGLA